MDLRAEPRVVLGKKVAALRSRGLTPGNVYGPGIASQPVQVPTADLRRVLEATGRNDLVTLRVGVGPRPQEHQVMVRRVDRSPVTGEILHVDFFRVPQDEPVTAEVDLVLVGEPEAVHLGAATLVHGQTTAHVSGLPQHLPSSIEVDIRGMTGPLHLRDVPLPPGITLLSHPDTVVASLQPVRGVEVHAAPAAEAAEPAESAAAEAAEER